MSEEPFDADLVEFEAVLRKLAPAAGRVSRDQVVFRAGRASARGRALWSGAAGLSLGLGIALAASLTIGRMFTGPAEVIYVSAPAERDSALQENPPEISPADLASPWQAQMKYLRLQEELATHGLNALPRPAEAESPKRLSVDQLLGAS